MYLKTILPLFILLLLQFTGTAQIQPPSKYNIYSDSLGSLSNHLLETESGEFLISGSATNGESGTIGCVTLIDQDGDVKWRVTSLSDLSLNGVNHAIELGTKYIIIGNSPDQGLIYGIDKETGDIIDTMAFECKELCSENYFVGKHALLPIGKTQFIVGGYKIFEEEVNAVINVYNENLVYQRSLDYPGAMGDQVIDIERASNQDILFFGTTGYPGSCLTTARNLGDDDDIWILRVSEEYTFRDTLFLRENSDDNFIDATPTSDNGFAILGNSSKKCFYHDETSALDWIRKFNFPVSPDETLGIKYTEDSTSTSILYDNGYYVTNQRGPSHLLHLQYYDVFVNPQWQDEMFPLQSDLNTCQLASYSYVIKSVKGCHFAVGTCIFPFIVMPGNKVLDQWGECQFLCKNSSDIVCGESRFGDTSDPDLVSNINDYSLCGVVENFAQPEFVYRLADFGEDGSEIFISMQELGAQQGGLDLFIIANCDEDPPTNNEVDQLLPSCIDTVIRNAGDPPALIRIPELDPTYEYYVIVDSRNTPGDFRVSVSCPENCADGVAIECDSMRDVNNFNDGSSMISAYFVPRTGEYIDQYSGSDYKVPFIAPRDGNFTFRLSDMGENVVDLFIIQDCNPFQCLAYSNEQFASSEELDLALDEGDTVYIIIDAMAGNSTTCKLTVECCEAYESNVFLEGGAIDTTICITEGMFHLLSLEHSTQATVGYTYILTHHDGIIVREIAPLLDVSTLNPDIYRIFGVSYEGTLSMPTGQNISDIESEICHVISRNSILVSIGQTYEVYLDTTICAGEVLTICDTELTLAGQDTVICSSQLGCDSIIYITLRINEPVVNISGPTAFCSDEEIQIEATSGFISYLWSNGETSATITISQPGLYIVTATDEDGCSTIAELEVEEVIRPFVDLVDSVRVCNRDTLQIEVTSNCQDCSYRWTPSADLSDPNIQNPVARPFSSTTYTLTTMTSDRVCTVQNSMVLILIPRDTLVLKNDHFIFRRNNEARILFEEIFLNDTIHPENRQIDISDVEVKINIESLPPEIMPTLSGNSIDLSIGSILDLHEFQYTLTDRTCMDTASAKIQLQIILSDIIIPCNPDEEPTGCVILSDIDDYTYNLTSIFDREGNMVHLAKDYKNNWRGENMQTGENVPTGTYYFVMNLGPRKGSDSSTESTLKGVITIVRR